eukprot:scaffold115781_cov48-Phaeocystis_antarctica.AAC.1
MSRVFAAVCPTKPVLNSEAETWFGRAPARRRPRAARLAPRRAAPCGGPPWSCPCPARPGSRRSGRGRRSGRAPPAPPPPPRPGTRRGACGWPRSRRGPPAPARGRPCAPFPPQSRRAAARSAARARRAAAPAGGSRRAAWPWRRSCRRCRRCRSWGACAPSPGRDAPPAWRRRRRRACRGAPRCRGGCVAAPGRRSRRTRMRSRAGSDARAPGCRAEQHAAVGARVALHARHERVDDGRLERVAAAAAAARRAEAAAAVGVEAIGLVDDEHAALRLVEQRVGALLGLAERRADEVRRRGEHDVALAEQAELAQDLAVVPRHGGLARARVAEEDTVEEAIDGGLDVCEPLHLAQPAQRRRARRLKGVVALAEQVGARQLEDVDGRRGGRVARRRAACGHHPRGLPLGRHVDQRGDRPRVREAEAAPAAADAPCGNARVLGVAHVVARLELGQLRLQQLDELWLVKVGQRHAPAAAVGERAEVEAEHLLVQRLLVAGHHHGQPAAALVHLVGEPVQHLPRRLLPGRVELVRVVNEEHAALLLLRAKVLATHGDLKVVVPARVH